MDFNPKKSLLNESLYKKTNYLFIIYIIIIYCILLFKGTNLNTNFKTRKINRGNQNETGIVTTVDHLKPEQEPPSCGPVYFLELSI